MLGMDPRATPELVKERIGVQLQSSSYFELLRLGELLDLFGSLYPRRLDPRQLLERVGLEDKERALVNQLSGGQAQRFAIVRCARERPRGRVPRRADNRPRSPSTTKPVGRDPEGLSPRAAP